MKRLGQGDGMGAKDPPSVIVLFLSLLSLVIWPTLLLFLAGDWRWGMGWLFGGWFVGLCASCIFWLYHHDPALLRERFRMPGSGGQKAWDQVLIYFVVVSFIAWVVIMPLDAKRFRWTPAWPAWLRPLGGALLLASWFWVFRSFRDNTYLSPLVRIQTERAHRVVSTGVYALIRHPMYLGANLMFLGAPLLLGSLCGLVVGLLLVALLIIRILGEERMLVAELEGYAEYQHKVRYRLLPHIW
jgi:protein-S-isoprenylcysteine O-methyltransferase Ste14